VGKIFDRDDDAPDKGPADAAHDTVRSVASLVPGGAALLEWIVVSPLERRNTEWMNDVAVGLRQLEEKRGVSLHALRDNPAFIDAVLTATQAALRTNQTGKRAALLHAVLNSALGSSPDVTRQQVFLSLVDRLTDVQLSILQLFHDPQKWAAGDGRHVRDRSTGDAGDMLREAYPELAEDAALCDVLWTELYNAGLVNIGTLHTKMEGSAVTKKRTTPIGDDFLAFIRSPV
jgi:hypothetical protein